MKRVPVASTIKEIAGRNCLTGVVRPAKPARLASLDALRGFDMLFIMGGEGFLCAIASALGFPAFAAAFGHAEWHGLHFMDIVFPLFLFGGIASLFPDEWGNVVLQLGYIAVCWLFLYFLHRKGVYLKV